MQEDIMSSFINIKGEWYLLSRMRTTGAIHSMASVGDVCKMEKGDTAPIYRNGKLIDEVKIPLDFFKLASISQRMMVWYWDDTEVGKDSAFDVRASGLYIPAPKTHVSMKTDPVVHENRSTLPEQRST